MVQELITRWFTDYEPSGKPDVRKRYIDSRSTLFINGKVLKCVPRHYGLSSFLDERPFYVPR